MTDPLTIHSLIPQFLSVYEYIASARTDRERQERWSQTYMKPNMRALRPYFEWVDQPDEEHPAASLDHFREHYHPGNLQRFERACYELAPKCLNEVAATLRVIVPQVRLMLNVGLRLSNGFVARYRNEFTTFVNLEHYHDIETLRVFLVHELIHAVHLAYNPFVYYWPLRGRFSADNHLILEGLATEATARVLDVTPSVALQGKLRTGECRARDYAARADRIRECFIQARSQPTPINLGRCFGSLPLDDDETSPPITRSGYWLGTQFIHFLKQSRGYAYPEIIGLRGRPLRQAVDGFLADD
ncbi:MAG: hypothetical protein ABIG71_04060 [Candidatus Uhrbacteria bacterium]